jgi:NADH:ubiquinone oxidoreductase subunit 2 (subunit N)
VIDQIVAVRILFFNEIHRSHAACHLLQYVRCSADADEVLVEILDIFGQAFRAVALRIHADEHGLHIVGTGTGVGQKLPLSFAAFGIAGLNLAGMPPSGGFIGKWLLLGAALSTGQWWWALVIALGSLLAAGYVFLVLRAARPPPRARPLPPPPNRRLPGAALLLAILAMVLGVFAETPVAILGAIAPVPPG